jgi:hypothetical protein
LKDIKRNFQFCNFSPYGGSPAGRQFSLKLNEWVFIFAGIFMLISAAFLDEGGFGLWASAKAIYLIGVIIYVWNRNI